RIKGWQRNRDNQVEAVDIANLGTCPIHFPAGGKLTATHPVKKDDEGMAVFQSRCIDLWWRDGGQQQEHIRRRHNLSDAMYVPGFRNKPRQLDPAPSQNSYQIRTDDGKYYVELTDDGVCHIYATKVFLHAPNIEMNGNQKQIEGQQGSRRYGRDSEADTRVEIKGWLHVTRDIDCDQNINAKRNITADQTVTGRQEVVARTIRLTSHRHSASGGTGTGGPPVP
ncbi:MAG: hypothetical protein J2P48_16150, partial [Alphaproteobacteria bacterium]|nr:hypothetical protein [Alphaproteobacteria bacterium]